MNNKRTDGNPSKAAIVENNRRIVRAIVPAAALAECIELIRKGRFGDFPSSADCSHAFGVVRKYGGDAMAAQALQTRLLMVEMLQSVDVEMIARIAALTPETLGTILANMSLKDDDGTLEIDGMALAQAIRAAGPVIGSA